MSDQDDDQIDEFINKLEKSFEVSDLCDQLRAVLYHAAAVAEDILNEEEGLSPLGRSTLDALFTLAHSCESIDMAAAQYMVELAPDEDDPLETMPPEGAVN